MEWLQAQADNPDPDKLIPVPIYGYEKLRERQQIQIQELESQQTLAENLSQSAGDLESKLARNSARILKCKIDENQLSHRLLKILTRFLVESRRGLLVEPVEDSLRARLQALGAQLAAPAQSRARLIEISSILRSQPDLLLKRRQMQRPQLELPGSFSDEIDHYLQKCQDSLERMVETVGRDRKSLAVMEDWLTAGRAKR